MDDDNLTDAHWNGEMREVELWENERWNSEGKGWGKAWLKQGDRAPWTRARDGYSGVSGADVRSGYVFLPDFTKTDATTAVTLRSPLNLVGHLSRPRIGVRIFRRVGLTALVAMMVGI